MWPDAADVITESFATHDGSYDDRPNHVMWCDSTRSRVRVVQCHWDEGNTWWTATYTRSGFLASPIRSPFLDHKGQSASGLLMHSAHVDRENNRFGMVRDMISLQDEINKRRSKALHLLSVAQIITEKGAVQDIDKARREVAKPDGAIEVMPGMRFEISHGGEMAQGQMRLLEHATNEMQATGPNASMSGTDDRELSGRAILAQQAGGAAQNEPIADGLREWMQGIYEIAWMAARQYWTAGKWVRVTDDLGNTKYVGINQPVTLQDELAKMPDQHRAQVMQQLQIVPGDPRLQTVVRTENDITDMDIDVTIGAGIDVPSMQGRAVPDAAATPAGTPAGADPARSADCRVLAAREGQVTRNAQAARPAAGATAGGNEADYRCPAAGRSAGEAIQGRGGLCPGQRAPARHHRPYCRRASGLHGHERAAGRAVRTRHRGAACRASGDGRGGHPGPACQGGGGRGAGQRSAACGGRAGVQRAAAGPAGAATRTAAAASAGGGSVSGFLARNPLAVTSRIPPSAWSGCDLLRASRVG